MSDALERDYVLRIARQMALSDQGRDLLGRKGVAGANGGVARHQAEQVIEQLLARRQAFLGAQVIDDLSQSTSLNILGDLPSSSEIQTS